LNWKKNINIVDARKLTGIFCRHFDLPICNVYYVDTFQDQSDWGVYVENPDSILILEDTINKIGILMHELTHHLEYKAYELRPKDGPHGYNYQLAKERVLRWCYKNISTNPDWRIPLKAYTRTDEMVNFRL
jgi:hypothetical protein